MIILNNNPLGEMPIKKNVHPILSYNLNNNSNVKQLSQTLTIEIMLEHQKMVLKNVAYNNDLFRKELLKSLAWLNSNDLTQLRVWLRENYWNIHREIIQDIMYPYRVTA